MLAASVLARGKKGSGVEILSLPDLRPVRVLHTPHGNSAADDLMFLQKTPDTLLTCGQDGCVKLWDARAKGGGPQRTLRPAGRPVCTASVSADDSMCAIADGCSIRAIDVGSGKELFVHEDAHSQDVRHLRFHPCRVHELVSAGDDGLLCTLDTRRCAEGKTVMEEHGLRLVVNNDEAVRHLAFVGEGSEIACAVSTTEVLQLWSLHESQAGALCGRFAELRADKRLLVEESNGSIVEVLYDEPSGRAHVLASAVDGRMAVYHVNLEGATFVAELPGQAGGGHSELVRSAAQLGTSYFATGSEDGHVLVWDAAAAGLPTGSSATTSAASASKKRRKG